MEIREAKAKAVETAIAIGNALAEVLTPQTINSNDILISDRLRDDEMESAEEMFPFAEPFTEENVIGGFTLAVSNDAELFLGLVDNGNEIFSLTVWIEDVDFPKVFDLSSTTAKDIANEYASLFA